MNLLIKWPSRERLERFIQTLDRWLTCLSKDGRHRVRFLFSFDAGDVMTEQAAGNAIAKTFERHRAERVAEWMTIAGGASDAAMASALPTWESHVGPPNRTKIEAINADVEECRWQWDALLLIADDMWPVVGDVDAKFFDLLPGFSDEERAKSDVAVFTRDGFRNDLCTLPFISRAYYDRFHYVYHPSYKSLWCDNEWQDVARSLNRLVDVQMCFVEHRHPSNTIKTLWDDLYRKGNSTTIFREDRANYEKRKASGAMGKPPIAAADAKIASHAMVERVKPLITIMIPTLKEREPQFNELTIELRRQCLLLADPTLVEVIFEQDSGEAKIGAKRQRMLEIASGDYVCSVDDDDMVEPSYVADLVHTIMRYVEENKAYPDAVVFRGRMTCDGRYGGVFDFDVEHKCYRVIGDLYQRTPNHLCPIRRDIAIKIGFNGTKQNGEDSEFARGVYPHIRNQAVVTTPDGKKKPLYHYRFSHSGTRTQRAQDKVPLAATA